MLDLCDQDLDGQTTDSDLATGSPTPAVTPHAALVIPWHKRLFKSYLAHPDGVTALHLNFGETEIVFDEPALFAFGEGLATHARFTAAEAARWGTGTPWPRASELLAQLIEAGLVQRAATAPSPPLRGAGRLPSPLPPAAARTPRDWRDGEAIALELTGRSLPLGYLELVVPVYRVAHPTLDSEGRQVGEANVFPAPLRLDVPTEWRECQHAGSRFQDAQPMNVSALRSMVRHWKPAMALLSRLRAVYLRRCPLAGRGWTVGEMQRLTGFVLAAPAWLLMQAGSPVANGALDPMLSSLYRVVDGVRMVMHRMLFTDDHEASRPPSTTITADEIYAYAERNTAFLSDHGVCAGPKLMIQELLRVLCDGLPDDADAPDFGPQVQVVLAEADRVLDYAMLGLQAYAVVFSLWPTMARSYEALAALPAGAVAPALRDLIAQRVQYLQRATRLRNEARRLAMEAAYADMYASCRRALGECRGAGETLAGRLSFDGGALPVGSLMDVLMNHFRHEQQVVRLADEVQARINALLGRPQPSRPLCAADLALHYRLVAYHYEADELRDHDGRLPCLADDLHQALGLRVHVDAECIACEEP